MNTRKLLSLVTLILICFSTTLYGNERKTETMPGVIRIIGDKYYPPYEMLDENGKPVGFCIDMIKEVMRRLNKQYTIRLVSRNEIMKEVKAGNADIVLELTYTNERAKILRFGTIYNYAFKGALFRNDDKPFTRFEQFKNKTVAAERGSYAYKLLKSSGFRTNIIELEDLTDGAEMLKQNICDAVLCNLDIANYIANQSSYKGLSCSGIDLPPEKFCLASSNEFLLTKVDFTIYDLKKDGTYEKFQKRWFVEDKSGYYLKIIYIGLVIFAALIAIFIAFSLLLHYKVKKAKIQLESNQKNLDLSLHAGDIGIWGYDVEKKLFYNVLCNYFPSEGRSYEEEINMIHPDDANTFAEAIRSASEGNPPEKPICVKMDNTGRRKWRYIEKEIHSIRDERGVVTKVIGTHKDITDSILKQNKINELLNDHEAIFNHTSIGTQYFDANGELIRINDAACEIFGIEDKEELLKNHINLFDNPLLKDKIDREHLKKDYFVIKDDFSINKNNNFFSRRKKEGIHYISTYIAPVFNDEGKLICIIVNNNDLTEKETLRKKVEEYAFRMKYILKESGVITWTYNPYTYESFENNENDNNIGRANWRTLLNETTDKKKVEEIVEQMNNRSIDSFNIRIRIENNKNSAPIYYNIHGTPFRDKDGKIIYYIGLSINITELIEIQNKLQHEKEEACKADKLKSAFLANMSHEIRTPLNSIIGFSDLLRETDDEKEKKQFIEIIKTNNDRLLKIIDDVLDLSKIESGTMKINIERIDIGSIFNETYEVFSHQMENSPIKIIYEAKYERCVTDCDRVRLTQVLTNFMTNAIKYTSSGHIRLGYECMDNGLRIYVEDTGQGISKDKKDYVFDRFEKLDSLVQGTGLGLSICKDIAKMFNGKIGVESDLGKGSTFWMWIPCECDYIEC